MLLLAEKNQMYKDINHFMIRTPTLSFNKYENLYHHMINEEERAKLNHLKDNSLVNEAILVASNNLYHKLIDFKNNKEIKKFDYFSNAVNKYLIRMSTRPTPFGLFSGIDMGRFSEEGTSFQLETEKFRKHAVPDIGWLTGLVKEMTKRHYHNLSFKVNGSVYFKGERAYLLHSISHDTNEKIDEISVRITKPLEMVIELAKGLVPYDNLATSLRSQFKNVPRDVIESFLMKLIENEFLISNLYPPLTNNQQFDYIINEMNRSNILKHQPTLVEIKDLLDKYNDTPLGEGIETYKEIRRKMRKIINSRYYLQVDTKLHLSDKRLNKRVVEDINRLLNILLPFSTTYQEKDTPLSRYKQDFIDKYGINREVSLLEMLDNDLGIGAPIGYEHPKNNHLEQRSINNLPDEKIREYFIGKYVEAINKRSSIKLLDEDVEKLGLSYNYHNIPDSLEMNIIIKNDVANKKYQYYLGPNLGSTMAGKTFGRFAHLIENDREFFQNINNEFKKMNRLKGHSTCELVYTPETPRNGNVVRNRHESDYELVLHTNSSKATMQTLSIDDIYIGIENNQFYAKSKSLDEKLIITVHNMLNTTLAPNAIRFLHEISLDGKKIWYDLPWDLIFSEYPYVPKIEYENFTIAPEKWVLNRIIQEDKWIDYDTFLTLFNDVREKYRIPQYVYLAFADNRLLLNLMDQTCLKILHHEFNNRIGNVLLTSYEVDGENIVKDGTGEKYFSEFVIPLIKVDRKEEYSYNPVVRFNNISGHASERLKVPFNGWLYLKLYGINSSANIVVSQHIPEFLRPQLVGDRIEEYFFMRYADPKQHIRLRVKAEKNKLIQLYPEIMDWLQNLMASGMISHFTIDTYEREIERYGGLKLIKLAETLFHHDSMVVENILKLQMNGSLNMSDELIGMISTIHYMEMFEIPYEKQLQFLQNLTSKDDYREEFRQKRSTYMKLSNTDNKWEGAREDEQASLLLQVLNQRTTSIKNYLKEIDANLDMASKVSILDSVIHLHCNRLFGINRELEKKILTLTAHTLYALKYLKLNKVQSDVKL